MFKCFRELMARSRCPVNLTIIQTVRQRWRNVSLLLETSVLLNKVCIGLQNMIHLFPIYFRTSYGSKTPDAYNINHIINIQYFARDRWKAKSFVYLNHWLNGASLKCRPTILLNHYCNKWLSNYLTTPTSLN